MSSVDHVARNQQAMPSNAGTDTPAVERHPERGQDDGIPKWQQRIWVGCSIGLMFIIVTLCVIVVFALAKMMILLEIKDNDHLFQFAGMNLVSGSLLRLLAILIGGAIAFVGLAVSFFAHQKATSLDASIAKEELLNAKAALATYSPGIIAIIIGSIVIISSIYARGTYNYRPASVSTQGAQVPVGTDPLPDPKVFQDETEAKDEHLPHSPAPGD
jgi:hypothetical protein